MQATIIADFQEEINALYAKLEGEYHWRAQREELLAEMIQEMMNDDSKDKVEVTNKRIMEWRDKWIEIYCEEEKRWDTFGWLPTHPDNQERAADEQEGAAVERETGKSGDGRDDGAEGAPPHNGSWLFSKEEESGDNNNN